MGNIVGKPFGVVASINYEAALEESVKEGNQAKFYLASQRDGGLDFIDPSYEFNAKRRNALIINGNKIQGISEVDSAKLDELKNVTKIFQYKGSIASGTKLLALVPPNVKVGDVWNVEKECYINDVGYPAYTNFVYIGGHEDANLNWDSLGGTMQIGTEASKTVNNTKDIINFNTPGNIPINNFSIGVDNSTGLYFDKNTNKLSLNYVTSKPTQLTNKDVTYWAQDEDDNIGAISKFTLEVSTELNIDINNNVPKLSLHLSTADEFALEYNDRYTNLIISASSPINSVKIPIGSGLDASTIDGISIKISSEINHDINWTHTNRNNGLDIDSDRGIFIALSSAGDLDSQYIPNGLRCVEMNNIRNVTGGLILDGNNIADWLQVHKKLESYINSLIDAKLKAQ